MIALIGGFFQDKMNGAEGSRTPDLNNANVAFYQTELRPRNLEQR